MSKLTKRQARLHEQACDLLQKPSLTLGEKFFVYEHWHEGANHVNSRSGAFFTPFELANDFKLEVHGPRVADLCAGTGILSFMYYHCRYHDQPPQVTCVEINPAYVEVGRKLFPEAHWICADVFDVWRDLGRFDSAIANPPFGRSVKAPGTPGYSDGEFEYKIIDLASRIAEYGVFILPQQSAGFRYSGAQHYQRAETGSYNRFAQDTGLYLEAGCGIDTTVHQDGWRGVSPRCEIVCCNFPEQQPVTSQLSLFDRLADQVAA